MAEPDLLFRDGGVAVLEPDELPTEAPWDDHVGATKPRRRGRRLLFGIVAFALGIAAALAGASTATGLASPWRIAMVLLGLVAVYVGIDRLGSFFFGEEFDTAVWLSVAWLVAVLVSAVFADLLPLAESRDVSKTLLEPTMLRPDLFSEHPLGTDRQGLDILGGVVYGARVSLTVAVGAAAIGMIVGGTIGLVAGYFRGKVESIVGVLTDSMLAFPPLILLLGMVAVLQPSVRNVTIALGLLGIPTYIRLTRANTLLYVEREFVSSAKLLGARNRRIIVRELLPNVALPLLSYGVIVLGALIVAEASLSFLGLSIKRPNPTWGNMIAAGQSDFERYPHLIFGPGAVLFLTVFALNRVGDRARSIWDPRQRRL